jgi:hypothetical protein
MDLMDSTTGKSYFSAFLIIVKPDTLMDYIPV